MLLDDTLFLRSNARISRRYKTPSLSLSHFFVNAFFAFSLFVLAAIWIPLLFVCSFVMLSLVQSNVRFSLSSFLSFACCRFESWSEWTWVCVQCRCYLSLGALSILETSFVLWIPFEIAMLSLGGFWILLLFVVIEVIVDVDPFIIMRMR